MGLAEDVRSLLGTKGFVAAEMYIAEAPEKPDSVLVITPTGGFGPERTFSGGVNNAPVENCRIQIRTRSTSYQMCDTLMTLAYAILSGLGETMVGTWRYYYFRPVQTPYYLGLDEAARPVIAVNFDVQRKEDNN